MSASRGIAPLADIPDCEGRDGGPELVIRGEHPWLVSSRQAVPMLPRWRHEIGQPVQEVTRREFDDAVGTRACGLPPAPRADPVGRLVSGEHVADASDAAVFAAVHGEPFQREGRPGSVSQQMLETLKVARHVAIDERDPDASVHRETTVFPAEHCGGRVGVEEPLHAEPAHDTTAYLLGERGQIGLGDRPSRQKRRRPVTVRQEDAVGTREPTVNNASPGKHPVLEAVRWVAGQRRDEPLPARPAVVAAACLAGGCGLIRIVNVWPGESLTVACWGMAVAGPVNQAFCSAP